MKVYVRTWLAALMPSSFALERDATSMSWAFVRFFSSVFNDITAIYLNYSSVAPVMSKSQLIKHAGAYNDKASLGCGLDNLGGLQGCNTSRNTLILQQ